MATQMHPPYSRGVVTVDDGNVSALEARGFTRTAAAKAEPDAPKKAPAKKATKK